MLRIKADWRRDRTIRLDAHVFPRVRIPWKGLVQSLPISGGSVTELSATDAWLGAVIGDGTYMG